MIARPEPRIWVASALTVPVGVLLIAVPDSF
jgi:hypothetical protein